MKLGLALSGGGFRATAFHLGVLDRLAAGDLLKSVRFISTVSGGSLCVGLVYSASGYQWPTSNQYRSDVLQHARGLLTGTDLQGSFVRRVIMSPLSFFRSRANDLSLIMRHLWGISAKLKDIPDQPRWLINATCYETARNWRFESKRMGDYIFGYSLKPDLQITDAMAASAAFPGLIGPLVLETGSRSWVGYKDGSTTEVEPIDPAFKKVHLWDGGVYDNLGVEALYNQGGGYREGVDFLIVSDASGKPKSQEYRPVFQPAHRLVSIAMDQVRSLRARSVVSHLRQPGSLGRYLQIDNSCPYILRQAGLEAEIKRVCSDTLPEEEVKLAAEMDTTIRRLTSTEFERLFRHGFEVTDLTLHAYAPTKYPVMGYNATHG